MYKVVVQHACRGDHNCKADNSSHKDPEVEERLRGHSVFGLGSEEGVSGWGEGGRGVERR